MSTSLWTSPQSLDLTFRMGSPTLDGRLDSFGHSVAFALDLSAGAAQGRVPSSEALAEDQHALADLGGAGRSLERLELGSRGGSCIVARARVDDAA
jgi:hypothetical protein